ncbi:hypothetical protein NQ315_017124 [Exocentrus adspersus]|uniref:Uncharacterized protein n=1 Tax=Exocentrus adspersus TaxID=1586481 RepID=A0AAV8VBY0_9CUCU|nr:hypothetical protein NQ315_017124 [Exocentrus adspersus]
MAEVRQWGGAKKRGHQHHPRNEGTRKRAALALNSNNAPLSIYSKNNVVTVQKATAENQNNVISNSASSPNTKEPSLEFKETPNKAKCDIEVIDLTNCDDDIINNVQKQSNTNENKNEIINKSVKEDRNRKLRKPKRSKSKKRDEEKQDMSLIHRPEAEGSSLSDQENEFKEENLDPEIEELSKLRCTSEMTEVVAEREKRRNRRCADYPGLAFSSIFSSDTLMKFSIIRNELHNIMNTQLKRNVYFLKWC